MDKELVCCVTGHRPKGFPWDYHNADCDQHLEYLESMVGFVDLLIRKEGVKSFIAGGALGADTDFAETVLDLRDNLYNDVKLEIAVPCNGQDARWSDEDMARYKRILERADKVTVLSDHYTNFCMQKRNEYMVDHSDIVFAFVCRSADHGGTVNCIKYAQRKKKRVDFFYLEDY